MDAPPIQYVKTSDGYSIAYRVSGEGAPLVLVPGVFSHLGLHSFNTTRMIFQPRATQFRFIEYDSRGQGLSTRGLPDALAMEDFLADLVSILERVGGEPAVLISTFGFWRVAVRYAVEHPTRCRALVIVRPDHPVGAS